jgi:hypothetical protein
MAEMSRGDMIRRLDEVASDVQARLANGPLTPDEQHALGTTLARLLPAVADTLQDQLDRDAAERLRRDFWSPAAAATSTRLIDDRVPAPGRRRRLGRRS